MACKLEGQSVRERHKNTHGRSLDPPSSQLPVHSSLFTAPYSQLPLGEQAANAEAQEAALPKKAIAAHDMLSDPTLSKEHAVDPEELAQKLRMKAS